MKKKKFGKVYLVVLFLLILIAGFIKIKFFPKYYTAAHFGIETVTSDYDKDGDGIDDQTDFLQGVKDYVDTKPVYKSKYYGTGYPDDGYGVCTDVVANGYLAAGYDIKTLLAQDVTDHREDYNIDIQDANIDFRRVRNLKVYLENTAQSLTIDIYDIAQWQAGDIVVFESHIGVISDHRNKEGIPYVIHHGSPTQTSYEQDILEEKQDEIVGHYRLK